MNKKKTLTKGIPHFGDRKGTTIKNSMTKNLPNVWVIFCAICLNTLVLLGNDPVTPSNCSEEFLGAVCAIFWFCESFLAPDS